MYELGLVASSWLLILCILSNALWPFRFLYLWSIFRTLYHYSIGFCIFFLLICRGSRHKPVLILATLRSLREGLVGRELIWEMIQGREGFPGGSAGKESACNAGDTGSISESGRSAGEGIGYPLQCSWASLVAQLVKNLPAMRETWVRSLGWEDPLENGKATHSSILAWRIPWII